MAPVPHAVQISQLKTLELAEVDLSNRPNYKRYCLRCVLYILLSDLVIFLVTKVSPLLGLS